MSLKSSRHYRGRAAHLREVARDTTPTLRAACLKAAKEFDLLAEQAANEEALAKQNNQWS